MRRVQGWASCSWVVCAAVLCTAACAPGEPSQDACWAVGPPLLVAPGFPQDHAIAGDGTRVAVAVSSWDFSSRGVSVWETEIPVLDSPEPSVAIDEDPGIPPPPPCALGYTSVELRGSEVVIAAGFARNPAGFGATPCLPVPSSAWVASGTPAALDVAALSPAGAAHWMTAALASNRAQAAYLDYQEGVGTSLRTVAMTDSIAAETTALPDTFWRTHLVSARDGERVVLAWMEPTSVGRPTLFIGELAEDGSVGAMPVPDIEFIQQPASIALRGDRIALAWILGRSATENDAVLSLFDGTAWREPIVLTSALNWNPDLLSAATGFPSPGATLENASSTPPLRAVFDSNGNVALVMTEDLGDGVPRLRFELRSADGELLDGGPPAAGLGQAQPRIAALDSGELAISWLDYRGDAPGVYFRRIACRR